MIKCVECGKKGDVIEDNFFYSVKGPVCEDCYRSREL